MTQQEQGRPCGGCANTNVDIIFEKVEAAILGGKPQSLVRNVAKEDSKPNLDLAETILASAERLLSIGSVDNDQSDCHYSTECAVLRCQLAGMKGDFESVIKSADAALWELEARNDQTPTTPTDRAKSKQKSRREVLTASALGYKGFALTRLGRHSEALPILESSINIRRQMRKPVNTATPLKKHSEVTFAQRRERREALATSQALTLCYQTLGVVPPSPPVIKFPRTAHLFDTGGTATTPDDLVVSDKEAVLSTICDGTTRVIIEEKIDGANLGFSLCPVSGELLVQNRSHYVSSADHAQYNRITEWVAEHRDALMHILSPSERNGIMGEKRILYGEWVVAKHSIPYNKLPDYFVAFDIFDETTGKFFSRVRFHTTMKGTSIPVVPVIAMETFGPYAGAKGLDSFYSTLRSMLNTRSAFRDDGGFVEGIVLRVDESSPVGTPPLWMEHRWKVVRPDFVGGCQGGHWSARKIEKQQIDYEFAQSYLSDCCKFAESDDDPERYPMRKTTDSSAESENHEELNGGETKLHTPETPSICNMRGKRAITASSKREQREFQAQLSRARRRVPRCIVLMGLPASGKSTFASRLANGSSGASAKNKWTIVNQDSMGRKECVAVAGKVGRSNRIILDRCNLVEAERSEWLRILHNPPPGEVTLVHFAAPAETCVERAMNRVGHETIPHGRGERIILGLANRVEVPTQREKRDVFGTVEVVRTYQESDALLRRWGVAGISANDDE